MIPIVAVDIDGTLAQYHRHFFDFADHYFDAEFSRDYGGSGAMSEHMGLTKSEYRACKLAYRQGGQKRSIPLYPGAEAFMWWLSEQKCEVWITTTRPYQRLDGMDPDTRFWLDSHGIHYDHLLYDGDKYEVMGRNVDKDRVIAIIDDLPEQCAAAAEIYSSEMPLMPERRHNTHHGHWTKFNSFNDLTTIIKGRIEDWYAKYP